mgnify:CR=1 FL=1
MWLLSTLIDTRFIAQKENVKVEENGDVVFAQPDIYGRLYGRIAVNISSNKQLISRKAAVIMGSYRGLDANPFLSNQTIEKGSV